MITYREYCKLNEDWGKTSPIPKEEYDFPDPLKSVRWVDLGLKSGLLWAESNTLNPADRSPYWTWDEIMASDYAEYVPEVKDWLELVINPPYTTTTETEMRAGGLRIPLVGYYPQGDTSVPAGGGGYYWTAEEGEYPDEAIHVFIRPGQNSIVKDFDYKTSKMCLRLVKYK